MTSNCAEIFEAEIDQILPTISKEESSSLTLDQLINRMDTILNVIQRQLAPNTPMFGMHSDRISDLMGTKLINQMPEEAKRHFAKIVFDFLIQRRAQGLVTISPFALRDFPLRSPLMAIMNFEIQQRRIISSRIMMELFIDILHFGSSQKRLETKKSKLGKFRDWIMNAENPFHYFANVIIE